MLSPDLARSLGTDLIAVLVVALLAVLWLVVTRAWRSTLPEHASDDEAKDVRWGSCGVGCGCAAGTCRRASERPGADRTVPLNSPHSEIRR